MSATVHVFTPRETTDSPYNRLCWGIAPFAPKVPPPMPPLQRLQLQDHYYCALSDLHRIVAALLRDGGKGNVVTNDDNWIDASEPAVLKSAISWAIENYRKLHPETL